MPVAADSDEENPLPMATNVKEGLQERLNEIKSEIRKSQKVRDVLPGKNKTYLIGRAKVSCSKLENVLDEVAMTQKERFAIAMQATEDLNLLIDAQAVASRRGRPQPQ